jgi:5-methylcytosine-specific restriction protein B
MSQFSWVPLYEELASKLVPYRTRQRELVTLLDSLRAKDLKITPLQDKDEAGRRFLFEEIDPFTFFATFNRGITDQNRIGILRELAAFFGCKSPLPSDFDGIPLANNQKSWFIAFKANRPPAAVDILWDVFCAALGHAPFSDPAFAAAFDRALGLNGVNFNLTMGLFWVRPSVFLNLDQTMRSYLKPKVPPAGLAFAFYKQTVDQVRSQHKQSFPALSHEAYKAAEAVDLASEGSAMAPASDIDYWMVGAYWDESEPRDQTERFLAEGVWENGYEDRFLEEVRAMKVGDRIAIKAVSTQREELPFDARGNTVSRLIIKATGTIAHNPGTGRSVDVEWEPAQPPRFWYFYTARPTVWHLRKDDPLAQRLIDFAFRGAKQDFDFFVKLWFDNPESVTAEVSTTAAKADVATAYDIGNALAEGLFLSREEFETVLRRLRTKRNLILQGAPGVGKTFFARRLAYALLEAKDDARIDIVQFHPSYSYEDFVRGYKPTERAGQFELRDGPFLRTCKRAADDPDRSYVLIIDEINRGNLSQVLGEMFLLLEADKRGKSHAVTPLYPRHESDRLFVPANLHVIGTMNIADRSLALVDFALRRRFAFVTLEPRFADSSYRRWMRERNVPDALTNRIVQRMTSLNEKIALDSRLGPAFRIGHSFFCPHGEDLARLDAGWYRDVVTSEIEPLLGEYWHDEAEKVKSAVSELLSDA